MARTGSPALVLLSWVLALGVAVMPADASRPASADGQPPRGVSGSPSAVDVGEQVRKLVEADWIDQDRRFSTGQDRPTAMATQPTASSLTGDSTLSLQTGRLRDAAAIGRKWKGGTRRFFVSTPMRRLWTIRRSRLHRSG